MGRTGSLARARTPYRRCVLPWQNETSPAPAYCLSPRRRAGVSDSTVPGTRRHTIQPAVYIYLKGRRLQYSERSGSRGRRGTGTAPATDIAPLWFPSDLPSPTNRGTPRCCLRHCYSSLRHSELFTCCHSSKQNMRLGGLVAKDGFVRKPFKAKGGRRFQRRRTRARRCA